MASADYISREAAKEAAWENIINNVVEEQGMYGYLINLVDKVFDTLPAADVRPVVLCKDCLHEDCAMYHGPNWFCADGAKREES